MNKIIIAIMGLIVSLNAAEIYATFTVQAAKSASLAFDAGGIVRSVHFDIADSVKKGALLAVLSNKDKKANLESAQTALKYAKKDYERQEKVKSLIDEGKFDAVAYKYENAQNKAMYQEALYNKTFLKAPFDGVIFFKNIEVGDAVSGVSLKTVFKIESKHTRKLIVSFDQKYRKSVKVGDTFAYKIEEESKTFHGKISKIYPSANANNRKMQAEVKAKDLIVGLFGDGKIITQEK